MTIAELIKHERIVRELDKLRLRRRHHAELSASAARSPPAWTSVLERGFEEWLSAQLATLPPRHARAVRKYLESGRKTDVEALGVPRAYFNKLLARLGEKWMRVSR